MELKIFPQKTRPFLKPITEGESIILLINVRMRLSIVLQSQSTLTIFFSLSTFYNFPHVLFIIFGLSVFRWSFNFEIMYVCSRINKYSEEGESHDLVSPSINEYIMRFVSFPFNQF